MKLSIVISVALLVGWRAGVLAAQDIGQQVHSVFAAKCAGCHGPDLSSPKGRFGYVLDLPRLRQDPEKVIPSEPDQSELLALVERDEMPPKDSPHGALTHAEKEIIRSWIAAGAPDAAPELSSSSVQPEPPPADRVEVGWFDRGIAWFGKFHLLMLHFPIALVLAAALGEGWALWRGQSLPSEAVRFCLLLAALMAVPTAGFGWLFAAAGNGVGSPRLLLAHRWLGTSAAVLLVITAVCAEWDMRRGARSLLVRILLAASVLTTALTAHLGGLLIWGDDFFAY